MIRFPAKLAKQPQPGQMSPLLPQERREVGRPEPGSRDPLPGASGARVRRRSGTAAVSLLSSIVVMSGCQEKAPPALPTPKAEVQEYVIVRYPLTRDAFIDDNKGGLTNVILPIDGGKHRFHLGSPKDYEPALREVIVSRTDPIRPMEVSFDPLPGEPSEEPTSGKDEPASSQGTPGGRKAR